MARPSNADLIARVKELEAQQNTGGSVSMRVRGLLKEIVRHPERAKALAEEALGLI